MRGMTSRPPPTVSSSSAFALAAVASARRCRRARARASPPRRRRRWSGRGAASSTAAPTRRSRGWWPRTARRRTRRCAGSSCRRSASRRAHRRRARSPAGDWRRAEHRRRATSGCGTGRSCASTRDAPRSSTPPPSWPRSAPSCGAAAIRALAAWADPEALDFAPAAVRRQWGEGKPGALLVEAWAAVVASQPGRAGSPPFRSAVLAIAEYVETQAPEAAHEARDRALARPRVRDRRDLDRPAPVALAARAGGRPSRPSPRRPHRRRDGELLRPRRHRRPDRVPPRRVGLDGRSAPARDARRRCARSDARIARGPRPRSRSTGGA